MIYKNILKNFRNIIEDISNLEENHPFIGKYLVFGYRLLYAFKFLIEKKFLLLRNRKKYGKLYFHKVYWVNPKTIKYVSGFRERQWHHYSQILGGDWDQSSKLFENTSLFLASKMRFVEGRKRDVFSNNLLD